MHPVLIDFGFWQLSTYGTLVALGYLTGILWLKSRIKEMRGMDEDKFWFLIYALFFGAVGGGKILYILVSLQDQRWSDIHILRDFRYGFVFFGGFLGSCLVGIWAARRLKLPYLATADYFGAALPMGHAIGRLGCLAAGCCYGKPTELPWGVKLGGSPFSVTPEPLWGIPLHPTQLYESLCNAAIAAFVVSYALPRIRKGRWAAGTGFLAYVILYSIARFAIEFVRGDDRGWSYAGLWVSQWIAIAAALSAAAMIAQRGLAGRRK
jgi:phosphatidylglycerol:prolipoprotein diacylglycerol transferase